MERLLHEKDCSIDVGSYAMAICYALLDGVSIHQIILHWNTFTASRAQSLQLYLYCTVAFATARTLDFLMTPLYVPCGYRQYQWQLLDATASITVIILATLPAALFFTSYSSFAYSIAKVYDSLTMSESHRALRWVLYAMNLAVYGTLAYYWAYHMSTVETSPYDRIAQCTLAVSALTTATGFLAYGVLTLNFYNGLDSDYQNSNRAEQVERLFRMSRIVVVSIICTACFALRALLLLSDASLPNSAALIYFFFAEIVPTACMLFAFRARGASLPPLMTAGKPEYELLKNAEGDPYQGAAMYERRNSLSFNMERYQGPGVLGVGYAAHRGMGSGSNLSGMAGSAGQGQGPKGGGGDAKSFLVL